MDKNLYKYQKAKEQYEISMNQVYRVSFFDMKKFILKSKIATIKRIAMFREIRALNHLNKVVK